MKSLERFVDPSVIAALGPVAPPDARRRSVRPQVGGLRIQFDHDELAHVACVAGRPDGQLAGYVLEFRRDPDTRRWCITEMSRAEERRLVDPSERRHTLAAQELGRQLPADLTGLIASTKRAREDAAAAMERAQARAQALRDELARMSGGKSTWRVRKRIDLREQERVARVEAARWQRAIANINRELRELRDVQELREVRRLVVEGDPLMAVRDSTHLEALLGPIPKDRAARAAWRQAAGTVERYRKRWDVTDIREPLGKLPANTTKVQRAEREHAAGAANAFRREASEITASLAAEGIERD